MDEVKRSKKICLSILTLCVMSFFSSAFSAIDYKGEAAAFVMPAQPPIFLHDGIYLGGGIGYDVYKVDQNVNNTLVSGVTYNLNPNLALKDWNGSLFVGYGQYYDWFYIAGEVIASTGGARQNYLFTSGASSYESNIRVRTTYGFSILPGVRFTNAGLVYFRVGYVRTLLEMRELGTNAGGPVNVFTSKWANGLSYGVGIETAIIDKLSVRAEYNLSDYEEMDSALGTSFEPANNQFTLSLIYHFC